MEEDRLLDILRRGEVTELKVGDTAGVWSVTDPDTGKTYVVKRASEAEVSMTRQAGEFGRTLPADSNLVIPDFHGEFSNNLPADIANRFPVPPVDPGNNRLMVVDALPVTNFPDGQPTFANMKRYAEMHNGEMHPTLRGQGITDGEFDILMRDIEAMNRAGVSNNDFGSNMYVQRGEDGVLRFLAIDFEPHAFDPIYPNAEFEDVAQMQQRRIDYQDAHIFESPLPPHRAVGPGEVDTRPRLGTAGAVDEVTPVVPNVDGQAVPERTGGLTAEFQRADTTPAVVPDAPEGLGGLTQSARGTPDNSLRAAGDAAEVADALPPTKWQNAVDAVDTPGGVDGTVPRVGGSRIAGLASHAAGGAGFGLSAFHLYSQLGDENSTFYRDLENDEVDGRAIAALSLDATAFVADSVVIGTTALQAGRALRAADSLADAAQVLSGVSSASKFARIAGPVGVGITVVTTGLEYSIAETNEDGRRAGQAVGAGGGALGGAAIGAGLTWWLGPGAGVGAAVGGLIGAFGGGYAGGEYLDDDFQEYFDENALAEQRRNLEKMQGIGANLEAFIELENEVAAAYSQLQSRYQAINTEGKSEDQILAITPAQRSALQDAARTYEEKRTELSMAVRGAYLSTDDESTLADVQQFIQQRYAFLDMKEARLREAGDTEALRRLATDREGLEAAHASITRLQSTNLKLSESYGVDPAEIQRINTENIGSTWDAVNAQVQHVESYQAYILTNRAAEAQREFESNLERRLTRVNESYNGGQTDNALMQRSAVLMNFVTSGELDPSTYSEARADIEALQQQHQAELRGMKSSQGALYRMTREQRDLKEDTYSGEYAKHNLKTLRVVNGRVADLVQTHEMTEEIAGHALGAAEGTIEIQNLTARLHLDVDATLKQLASGVACTYLDDSEPGAVGVADERASAIYQIKSDIVTQSIGVTEHSSAILSIIGQDMKARLDDLQENLIDEREKAVPNGDTLNALGQVSEALINVAEVKVGEIEAYQENIQNMLDNGVSIEGEDFKVVSEDERARLEGVLRELGTLREQYTQEIAETRVQLRLAQSDIGGRVLAYDGVSVTLDHSGYVSSYSVFNEQEETKRFRGDQRPMLVDHDGNIYNNTSALNLTDVALYSPGRTITQMGEPYQAYWRPDQRHLATIEDPEEREQVRTQEAELVASLRGKSIRDAISAPPGLDIYEVADVQAERPEASHSLADTAILANPKYIEVAISMEKIRAGETLDSVEQDNIREILDDPKTDPEVIAQLNNEYAHEMETIPPAVEADTETDASGLVPIQPANVRAGSLGI